jgi:hypothetical protein
LAIVAEQYAAVVADAGRRRPRGRYRARRIKRPGTGGGARGVYLGAAALQKPAAAWPLFFGTFLIIAVNRTGITAIDATWVFLLLAVLLAAYGLSRGAVLPTGGLPLQTIAMAAFGAVAAAAVNTSGDAAAYLVAAGLLGHAAWDVYHHWTNRVVVRSMAEFCAVLDTALAVAIVAATATA